MNERSIRLDEINWHAALMDCVKNFWVILLVIISVLLSISAYQRTVYVPQYTSTATFVVNAKGHSSAYTSLNLTREMAQVFSEVFQSNVLREQVEKELGGPLDGHITTGTIEETNLITVSVTSTEPERAFRALGLFIKNYPMISDYLYNNAVLEVIKEPVIPVSPSNYFDARKYRNTGILIAFFVSLAAIVFCSVMRDTAGTPKAAKRKLDGRLLRSIRHEEKNKTLNAKRKRKNCAPLIVNPLVSLGFREDIQSLASAMEYHMRKRGQKVVLISSANENEGKSTIAANLALAFSMQKKKVLLLDCDFKKPALQKIFECKVDPTHDFGAYIMGEIEASEINLQTTKEGLCIGVNHDGFKYSSKMVISARLKAYIDAKREEMDYIIIDSPPMLVAADTEVLAGIADVSVLAVRENHTETKVINDYMDTLRQCSKDMAGYVLNNCHRSIFK